MNEVLHIVYALHLMLAMVLIGVCAINLIHHDKRSSPLALSIPYRYHILNFSLVLQLALGSYLVYARGYNWHIPWIQGAYILVLTTLIISVYLSLHPQADKKWHWGLNSLMLALLLLTAFEAASRSNLWIPTLW